MDLLLEAERRGLGSQVSDRVDNYRNAGRRSGTVDARNVRSALRVHCADADGIGFAARNYPRIGDIYVGSAGGVIKTSLEAIEGVVVAGVVISSLVARKGILGCKVAGVASLEANQGIAVAKCIAVASLIARESVAIADGVAVPSLVAGESVRNPLAAGVAGSCTDADKQVAVRRISYG